MSIPPVRTLADLLRLFAAPAIWFGHFAAIYGAEAIICTLPSASAGRAMVWTGVVATVIALAALASFAIAVLRRRPVGALSEEADRAFLRDTALLLTLLAALGVIWTAFPIAFLSACTAPAG
jgi:hypothetical protein